MEYGDVIWDNCTEGEASLLESIQYECARVVTGAIKGTSARALMNQLAWESLSTRWRVLAPGGFYMFKIFMCISPAYLVELLPDTVDKRTCRSLRSGENLTLFSCRTEKFKQSFFPSTVKLWNSLQTELRTSASLSAFKKGIKSIFCPLIGKKRFNVSLNCWASILHARITLGSHALNEYLFKINCYSSPTHVKISQLVASLQTSR